MNEYLADLYGTGGYTEEDLEKVAAYEMLTKLAEEEGVDLDALDDETVEELVDDLSGAAGEDYYDEGPELYEDEDGNLLAQGDDGELYYVDPEDVMDEEEKLASDQMEEADFLGRTMAHAYAQEMGLIEGEYDDDEYIEEYDDDSTIDKLAAEYAEGLLKEAFELVPSKLDPKPMRKHEARRHAANLKYGKQPHVSAEAGRQLTKEELKGYKPTRPSAKQRKAYAAAGAERRAGLADRATKKQRAARQAGARRRRGVTAKSSREAKATAMAEKNTLRSRIGGYHRGAVSDIMGKGIKGNRGWKRQVMRRGRGLAKLSPHAAVAGLGAYGGYKALTKEASSLDEAIEARAYELLALEGYIE
jgi:hypothetical protein